MKELRSTVIHHIEQVAHKAGVQFDHDCRTELEAAFDAAEKRIARLGADFESINRYIENEIDLKLAHLQEQLDTPDWRDRR